MDGGSRWVVVSGRWKVGDGKWVMVSGWWYAKQLTITDHHTKFELSSSKRLEDLIVNHHTKFELACSKRLEVIQS